ncbi:AAA domain containing protein [uncultured Caudovirales phage]|uniref:AAA domain containing protein n=1 Tax=uncultured Caudovirales phage TaxID=2100421 RepID=A0A6J5QS24_9CAUD|nr:AAA domain containing protein [uncultured Caudovirales phage]CAB4199384.1 AAA domain containing protein [uncultured Caudovirales phage]CAB4218785.1 AAA domain containing protein [uncultured Caudovirales phage]
MLPTITRGTVRRPQRLVIYAPEGLGKSTLASQLPNPLFLDFEQGTHHLDVARIEPKTLKEVNDILDGLVKDSQGFETLVIDTLDWCEELVTAAIIAGANNPKIKSIEDFGYGKGYTHLAEGFNDLLAKFNAVSRTMNVVCLVHVHVKKFELPDAAGAFDRYELKLSKQVGPLVREWCDALLFGNWKTRIREVEDGDKTKYKGLGGAERKLYAAHSAAWDAKNRHGLADEMPWSAETVLKCFGAGVSVTSTPAPAAVAKTVPAPVKAVAKAAPVKAAPVVIDTTVTAADDTIPFDYGDAPPVTTTADHPLTSVVGQHEDAVNSYLASRNVIKSGESYLSVSESYVARVLKNPDAFIAQCLKGVAV